MLFYFFLIWKAIWQLMSHVTLSHFSVVNHPWMWDIVSYFSSKRAVVDVCDWVWGVVGRHRHVLKWATSVVWICNIYSPSSHAVDFDPSGRQRSSSARGSSSFGVII